MPFELATQTGRGFSAWSVRERKLIQHRYTTLRGSHTANNKVFTWSVNITFIHLDSCEQKTTWHVTNMTYMDVSLWHVAKPVDFYINKGTKHSNKRFGHSLSCDCLDPKYLIGICGIRAGITQQVSDGLSNNDVQIFVFPRRFLHRGTHYHRHFYTKQNRKNVLSDVSKHKKPTWCHDSVGCMLGSHFAWVCFGFFK